jgi:hypothetical protein
MKTIASCLLAISVCLVAGTSRSLGATIPAGTVLVVRSLQTITSVDVVGTPFPVSLVHNVTVNGKVVLPAGTHISGKVVTSRRLHHSKDKLTVDLTGIQLNGRTIPITTTGAQFLYNFSTTRGVPVTRSGYAVAAGKQIHFQLARPVVL